MCLNTDLLTEINEKKSIIQDNLLQWFKLNKRNFEWRIHRTPYSVLISEILLKRTTATAAKAVYKDFLEKYPDVNRLSSADPADLEKLLLRIGYHRVRTKNLIELANFLIDRFQGIIPNSHEQLLEIPHVGNYTSNSVLTFGYGKPTAIVDSNVIRIIKRIFNNSLNKSITEKIIQKIADQLAPVSQNQDFNYALLDLGSLVCRYGLPKCELCPLSSSCDSFKK